MSQKLTTLVASMICLAAPFAQAQEVSAVVSAPRTAILASVKGGLLTELPVALGDTVSAGQVVAQFDCAAENAALQAAEAELKISAIETRTQRALVARGAGGRAALTQSIARQELREAERNSANVEVARCQITAPFSGTVADVTVRAHEIVQPGAAMLELLDTSALELEVIVPSEWRTDISLGTRMIFQDASTQKEHEVQVGKIAPKIDGVSQTIRIIAEFLNADDSLLAGTAGFVRIK